MVKHSSSIVKLSPTHVQHTNNEHRYMEIGPHRCSILQIGYSAVNANPDQLAEKGYREERSYISPLFRVVLDLQGHNIPSLIVYAAAVVGEILYIYRHMGEHGSSLIGASSLGGAVVLGALNSCVGFAEIRSARGNNLVINRHLDDMSYSGYIYLQLKGIDVLATAQEKYCKDSGTELEDVDRLKTLKASFTRSAGIETFVAHFLPAAIPLCTTCIVTAWRHFAEGDKLMGALALLTLWSKFVGCLAFAHIQFFIGLSQLLNTFEVRRVEADIRVCDVGLIHRVTPRFKAMLQESHAIGNASHKFFFMFAPIVFLYALQLIGGLFKSASAGEVDEEEGEVVRCVETWVFFALFQPLISLVIVIHGLAKLNLAIERDVDQVRRSERSEHCVEGRPARLAER